MGSTAIAAVLVIFLALVIIVIINHTYTIDITDGDRLMFGAIGIAGFTIAILTTEESTNKNSFVLG